MGFENRVALITGAGGGIGREVSRALRTRGARVLLFDARAEPVQGVAAELGSDGVATFIGSVASAVDVGRAVERCITTFGQLDLLVNLAAVFSVMPTLDVTEERWDHVLDVNLKGTFLCCQAVLPHMMERRYGRIVNVASGIAHRGWVGGVAYGASKAGVIGLTRSLAREVAPYGITVNVVLPGLTETPMPREFLSEDHMLQAGRSNPTGRLGLPSDIANAILFFLQDESVYVNGEALDVDGGLA